MITVPLLTRRYQRSRHERPQVEIRAMTAHDVDVMFGLWAAYATEQFGENLSYDRWGPGVPVPYDDEAAADEAPTQLVDPSLSVREHLHRLAAHPAAFALLAMDNQHPIGFLTASLRLASPTDDDQEGKIDTIYVSPSHRRRGIGSLLVANAVTRLREHGAYIFRVEVHPEFAAARRFWDHQPQWSHDARVYRIYD